MSKGLEALECLRNAHYIDGRLPLIDRVRFDIIESELILLNALRNKLNRKIETKEYKHEESNSYRIATLLTYELKEQWNDKELQTLKQFLLNLSGISEALKALEIIKNVGILKPYETSGGQCWLEAMCDATKITKDNYDLLKEVGL